MANHTNWLNISSMRGSSGQTILTLTASTNYESTERLATIKAYNPVYGVSATTSVRMSAYSPYIQVNPGMVGVPGSGGTYQFSISSNCSYVIAYPDLVSSYSASAGTGNTNITFTVPSTSADTTLVGNIVLTDTSGQYSTILRVEQYGSGVSITFSPSAVTIPFSGGSATFTVTANCVYSVNKGSETWYSVSPQSGYTGQTVFTISSTTVNTGDTAWTSSIDIVGPSGSVGTVSVTEEAEGSTRINYTADTSTIAASGDTRIITIDTTDFISSSITVTVVDAPEGVTAVYTQSSTTRGLITLTVPDNPGSPRDITVVVTGRRASTTYTASATIVFPQAAHSIVPIAYTADTSTVDASGETRTITIDTTNLVASSITIGIEGATGVSASYDNGVITVTFPENYGADRWITISVNGITTGGDTAISNISYEQEGGHTPINKPLTFNITSAGTIVWKAQDSAYTKTIQYSTDNGRTWTSITSSTAGTSFNVNAGQTVQFRGDNATYSSGGSSYNTFSGSTARFSVEGNIMSLIQSYDYVTATTLSSSYTFYYLFLICTGLTSAENLVLPATTLANNCYQYMFAGCTSLTTAPELPATTLTQSCYNWMFTRCTSLTTAPALPATTLANYCYTYMFSGCTSLISAPSLPATTLATSCYGGMFDGCTSLTTAPALPATTLAERCYNYMFNGCTSLTAAPALPATTLANYCYQSMFNGCTALTSTPSILPATTLAQSCYGSMFYNCSSLTSAPALPATTLAQGCYRNMFEGCATLTTAPELPATTLASECYYSMFNGCTSLTTAPELPATTLADSCYRYMFSGCTSLNYIKCLATDISASNCTYRWVRNVASAGTFVKDYSMTGWTIGENGIPVNWVVEDVKPYKNEYLTFNIISGGTIVWNASTIAYRKTIQYSKDNGRTWTSITPFVPGTFNVNDGETVQFRGDNATYSDASEYSTFSGSTAIFSVEGNIMSLIDSTGFTTATTLATSYTFYNLFYGCSGLTSAENLVLPATTLTNSCYRQMFQRCISLTTAPALPATTLAQDCYTHMFNQCTSLTSAPELSATTLADYCCHHMFSGCISLTTAPVLPATTLAEYCYASMFADCTSLTTVPSLPATTLAYRCYFYMFAGCTGLTTAPELPATTLASWCCEYMFASCTSLTTAPVLPATTLANCCYWGMFWNCTSLTTVPALPATTLAAQCCWAMFHNCTALTTAPELPAKTLVDSCYESMFDGCTSLNYIKCLATDISAYRCTAGWVQGVSATGTFVKNANMEDWRTGTDDIPSGWTVVDAT